jgi:predicted nucleotidyltransferase
MTTNMDRDARALVERFTAACRADDRVVAAVLGGSHARGTADAHSDVDLYAIAADAAYEAFLVDHAAFVRRLGEPVFLEQWRSPHGLDLVFFVLADGLEGELGLARESGFATVHGGAHRVLVDKAGLLDGVVFPLHRPAEAEQVETLRGQIEWFWHDLSHFTKAVARGQLWWAHGALEGLRRTCVQLARLRHDFAAEAEGYEKVEEALPAERLAPLRETICPLDRAAMLRAAGAIVRFYQELARPLAREHGLAYPAEHERIMLDRLGRLD